MDSKILRITNLIRSNGDWQTAFIEAFDCIKNLNDFKAIEVLLAGKSGAGQNLVNPLVNGFDIAKFISAYGTGSAYNFTNTAAAVTFGGVSPAIVLDAPGTYLIDSGIHVARAGATVAAETATVKVRRTNNTAADISVLPVIDLPVSTTLTDTLGFFRIPHFIYTTTLANDALSIFAQVSATLGAGTIAATAVGTYLTAKRLK